MLSRQILNASRVASKRVIAPATQSSVRTFKTVQSQQNAEEIKAGKVLTVTYKDGVRQEVEIPVEQNSGPVAPPGADDKKAAIPLDKSILGQLNPTMSKFTLPGKVAVVTG